MAEKLYDLIVVGAGPAGMMAAITAANSGASVTLIEKNEKLGLKLLATGNGRCNITNRNISLLNYHGTATSLFESIYEGFNSSDLERFFKNLGVEFVNDERGRVFPSTDKATTVLAALGEGLSEANVDVRRKALVKDVIRGDHWKVVLENGLTLESKALILTTGGKAAYKLGSSGDGLFWAMKLGHHPTDIYAALVPLELATHEFASAMGVRMKVKTAALVNGKVIAERQGDLLFTHFGVSGPAAMGLAGSVSPFVGVKKVSISIDLFPEIDSELISSNLLEILNANPKKKVSNVLSEMIPQKLANSLIMHTKVDGNKKAAELSKRDRQLLVSNMKNLLLEIKGVRPLKEAQVTAGGIPASEISEDLASKVVPELFFAGEIVDIDGDSGGYNLQWAWSSGYVAGKSAVKDTNEDKV